MAHLKIKNFIDVLVRSLYAYVPAQELKNIKSLDKYVRYLVA